jgi:hypothetical protein
MGYVEKPRGHEHPNATTLWMPECFGEYAGDQYQYQVSALDMSRGKPGTHASPCNAGGEGRKKRLTYSYIGIY